MADKERFLECRELRTQESFDLGINCWIDYLSEQEDEYMKDEDWVLGRGPEWIVREVTSCGIYASYKSEHAPTYFEFDQLVPYVDTTPPKATSENTDVKMYVLMEEVYHESATPIWSTTNKKDALLKAETANRFLQQKDTHSLLNYIRALTRDETLCSCGEVYHVIELSHDTRPKYLESE